MIEPARVPGPSPLERLCGEVNSKCASLRDASRLLPDLSVSESEEMLLLMTMETFRLATTLEKLRLISPGSACGGGESDRPLPENKQTMD
jgi:hypothetical protein